MPKVKFGESAYVEESYGLPQINLENLFAETANDRPDWGYRLIPTPGVGAQVSTIGGSEGRGTYYAEGVAGGEIVAILGAAVVRMASDGTTTAISGGAGAVSNDSLPVRFAASQADLVAISGTALYTITSSTITVITSSLTSAGASGAPLDVAVSNNRHLVVEAGSGRFYYSDPGDPTTFGGFVTAERSPDGLRAILVNGADVLAFGSQTIEFWTATDSSTVPLIQRSGFVLSVGIIGTFAKCKIGGVVYWVGHDGVVYQQSGSGRQAPISGPWLERQIAGLSSANQALVRMSSHNWRGHKFVKLYIPTIGDFFYDQSTGVWHRRKDLGDSVLTWSFEYAVEAFGKVYVQRLSNGRLHELSDTTYTENSAYVRRVCESLVPVSAATRVQSLIIEGQAGIGLDGTTAQGSDPECMLKIAYDGRVFGDEATRNIGKAGEWRWRPVFGPLGTLRPPVAKMQLAYTDPVGWVIYGGTYNERAV